MQGVNSLRKILAKCAKFVLLTSFVFSGANAVSWQQGDFKDIKKEANMRVLVIGANGSVAKVATQGFLAGTNVKLRLFLRNAARLKSLKSERVELFEGDATDKVALQRALKDVDVVYANLAGDLPKMAAAIIDAMGTSGVKRLVWVSTYGVYGEIPGSNLDSIRAYIAPYIDSVKLIEASALDYTIIRPQWFSNADEIDYELTKKGEKFKNPDAQISRKSIAHLVIRLCTEPSFGVRESFGINKVAR